MILKDEWVKEDMLGTFHEEPRHVTIFEISLLVLAILVLIIGFILIRQTFLAEGKSMSWLMVGAIFSWLTLLILFVVSELNADVKEELSRIMREQVEETRMLKELHHALLEEIRGLRDDLSRVGQKKRSERKTTGQ